MRISPLYIGLVLAGVCILGVLLYVFLCRPSPKTKPIDTASTTVQVTPLHSDVSVQRGDSAFTTITTRQAVQNGSVIQTSETGRALIESASAHITRIDYSSQITVQEEKKKTQVELAGGALWSRITNIFDSGETYDVETANAIASVRGTSFGVWYQFNTTTLIVIEGEVLFAPIEARGSGVLVRAGYKATRVGTGPIHVAPLTRADNILPWVVFNQGTRVEPMPAAAPVVTQIPTTSPAQPPVSSGDIVRLSGISPTTSIEGSQETLTITGRNLDQVDTLSIGGTQVYVTRVNTTTITATIPTLTPGRYSVSITAPGGRVSTLSSALTISARTASSNGVSGKP